METAGRQRQCAAAVHSRASLPTVFTSLPGVATCSHRPSQLSTRCPHNHPQTINSSTPRHGSPAQQVCRGTRQRWCRRRARCSAYRWGTHTGRSVEAYGGPRVGCTAKMAPTSHPRPPVPLKLLHVLQCCPTAAHAAGRSQQLPCVARCATLCSPVRHHDGGAPLHQPVQCLLHHPLALGVQR